MCIAREVGSIPSRLIAGVAAGVLVLMIATVDAAEFNGSWKGTLTGADGSAAEVQIDFSPLGFPLYSYTNNQGVARQVKLSHVGQTVEYVPAGGGVQRVVVKTLEQGQGRLRLVLCFPLSGRARDICNKNSNRPCSSMSLFRKD